MARTRGARRRDRHGRGFRGQVIPSHLPGHRSRREDFDRLVLGALQALLPAFGDRLRYVDVAVEDVPPSGPAPWEEEAVPLGRHFPADRARPARIVLYRRPIETRCETAEDLDLLVRQVLSEQIGGYLALPPDEVDPGAWDW